MRTGFCALLGLLACGTPLPAQDCLAASRFDVWTDADGDGVGDPTTRRSACSLGKGEVTNGDDCDDANDLVSPLAIEICDGVDQDCDGIVDDGVRLTAYYGDGDGDGYGDPNDAIAACDPPPGYVPDSADCDDADPAAFPGATEICNGVDDDCDGLADDDDPSVDASTAPTWYPDLDGDGFGDAGAAVQACENPDPARFVDVDGDCDDAAGDRYPGQDEICDHVDDNCDGLVDGQDPHLDPATLATLYVDGDHDGLGDDSQVVQGCFPSPGRSGVGGDCDDADAAVGGPLLWIVDADADGYGTGQPVGAASCVQPQPDTVVAGGPQDCADSDPAIHPGALEVCDAVDDDCDALVDDDDPSVDPAGLVTLYEDLDGDGVGNSAVQSLGCAPGPSQSTVGGDCDDGDPSSFPGADDVCGDGIDQDCSGFDAVC